MRFENHPCFSAGARHTTGRIHLPVAPKCNVMCNFCNRDFDCVNESRPGVTSAILSPEQAVEYLVRVVGKIPAIKVVGIAGPGDPFANSIETMETLSLVREKLPDAHLCVATNGLELSGHVDALAGLGVSHVTVTVNAVDPEIGAKIYAWVRPGTRIYRGEDGARILLARQIEGIRRLKEKGIIVKINTVTIPGINDGHVVEVARAMSDLGADIQNAIPLYHVEGTPFQCIKPPAREAMTTIRSGAETFIPQMIHCARCRADAAGLVGNENSGEIDELLRNASRPHPSGARPYAALASMEGLLVNQHLGEAAGLWIFELSDGKVELVGRRNTPSSGTGDQRWISLANVLSDCFAVITSGVGERPKTVLSREGISVIAMEGLAKEGLNALLRGEEIPKILLKRAGVCGGGIICGGTGTGCG
jgi:nitrogen fixation protein NifB